MALFESLGKVSYLHSVATIWQYIGLCISVSTVGLTRTCRPATCRLTTAKAALKKNTNYFYAIRISISLAILSDIFIQIGYFF